MTDIKFANDNLPKKVASFYSINNTQKGLSGVELGNFLIKRVVEVLRKEPAWNLDTFATLSPLPGFRLWFRLKVMMQIELHKSNQANHHLDVQMPNKFAEEFVSMCEIKELAKVFKTHDPAQTLESLLDILEGKTWYLDENLADSLKSVLMKHAAVYLAREKRRGKPLDPVANFHLSNGAEMYRLNYLADNSRTVCMTYLQIKFLIIRKLTQLVALRGCITAMESWLTIIMTSQRCIPINRDLNTRVLFLWVMR